MVDIFLGPSHNLSWRDGVVATSTAGAKLPVKHVDGKQNIDQFIYPKEIKAQITFPMDANACLKITDLPLIHKA